MDWDMEQALQCLKSKLKEDENAFLTALVAAMSFKEKIKEPDNFEIWSSATPQILT